MKQIMILLMALLLPLTAAGQRPAYGKMSPLVRRLARSQSAPLRLKSSTQHRGQQLCAFVEVTARGEEVLREQGCQPLAQFGNIFIANVPVSRIAALSLQPEVRRIEAEQSRGTILMDSLAQHIHATDAYDGLRLPQAFTGKGVVVGVQDIGFDLTHPNFYSRDTLTYRIQALWDQLSRDSSSLYVGADYRGRDALLRLEHSRDGLQQTHGTHTAGIAAGSGFTSPYRGIAFGSDLCLVANASSEDLPLIDKADLYKYTYATDALGFKYIFDYADAQGKPCVINFSEGSPQDFHGYDLLYYSILDSLLGPGHILVSSAGNEGLKKTYFHKPATQQLMGTTVMPTDSVVSFTLKSSEPFTLHLVAKDGRQGALKVSSKEVFSQPDSTLTDSTSLGRLLVAAYPSCYEAGEVCYDVTLSHAPSLSLAVRLEGEGAAVDYYQMQGRITAYGSDADSAGECSHNIFSPSSFSRVISVGATSYRKDIYTYLGEHRVFDQGSGGQLADYSSVGPTFDGRVKPDVVAPGTNVISSYNSFYIAAHPDAFDVAHSDKEHFQWRGRTYAWNYNSGTSMAAPAVAGAIALWLEADPKLTPEDILRLLARTCSHPDATLQYPNNRYGYGQIDVYRGLLTLLGLDGISDLSLHQPLHVTIRPAGSQLKVTFDTAPCHDFTVKIFAVSGELLHQQRLHGGRSEYRIAVDALPKGVYAVQVSSPERGCTGSSLVRI